MMKSVVLTIMALRKGYGDLENYSPGEKIAIYLTEPATLSSGGPVPINNRQSKRNPTPCSVVLTTVAFMSASTRDVSVSIIVTVTVLLICIGWSSVT